MIHYISKLSYKGYTSHADMDVCVLGRKNFNKYNKLRVNVEKKL